MPPERLDLALWRDVRSYLLGYLHGLPVDAVKAKVACVICRDMDLDIKGLPPTTPPASDAGSNDGGDGDEGGNSNGGSDGGRAPARERAFVLPCGHLVGEDCWRLYCAFTTTEAEAEGDVPNFKCPVCRFSLRVEWCGCSINVALLPRAQNDDVVPDDVSMEEVIHRIPRTKSEGGPFQIFCSCFYKYYHHQFEQQQVTTTLARGLGLPDNHAPLQAMTMPDLINLFRELELLLRGPHWFATPVSEQYYNLVPDYDG